MNARAFWLATAATLAVGAGVLTACPIVRVVKKRVVVVEKVVEAVVVPVIVAVPAYSTVFNPAAQTAAQPHYDCAAEVRALRAEIEALKRGAAPQQAQGPTKVSASPSPVAAPMLVAKCASCHGDKVAAASGNGLVLFSAGQPTVWTERQKSRAQGAVYSSRMPKGGKLTDEEVGQIMSEIDGMK